MALNNNELTQSKLKEVLWYNYETGHFTWIKHSQAKRIGTRAGDLNESNYRYIMIAGKKHKEHRLVWLYHYDSFPVDDLVIDHIDADRSNNTFWNLRLCTPEQNKLNVGRSCRNTSGYKGVSYNKPTGKWKAKIQCDGVDHYLGLYETPEQAHKAYVKLGKELHGEFFNAG